MGTETPLGSVPRGWATVRLAELCELITKGATPTTYGFDWADEGILFLRSECVATGRFQIQGSQHISPEAHNALSRSSIRSGDILITITGNVGRVCMYPTHMREANINQHIARIRVSARQRADTSFVLHVLQHPDYRRYYERIITGLAYPQISLKQVRETEIPVPPLPEQRKIAAILSSVDDAIEKTQAIIEQVQVVKKGLMQELLTRGLPGRHTKFKQTEIGEVPEEWDLRSYSQLAANVPSAIQSGPFGSALKHSEFQEEGVLVIGIDNVLDGEFSIGSNHRVSQKKFEDLRRFQARPGDLLITVMATVGRCCVVPDDIEPAIITKHVYRLSVDRERADPWFLMFCLYGIERLRQSIHGSAQGLSRPGLNKSLLMPLLFPLPSIREQQEIVEILRTLDERVRKERRHLESLQRVKDGLMSVLLTGEVRVTPDSEAA